MNEHEKDDDRICTRIGIAGMGIIFIGWLTLAATIALWILSGNEKTFLFVGFLGMVIAVIGLMLSFLAVAGSSDTYGIS